MANTFHIRRPMPRKGGNSFYRDRNDYSKFAVSLCGASITDHDADWRTAGTKKFQASPNMPGWDLCADCAKLRAQ